jgi:DNA-binding GntR family transcriptional regulator
MLNQPELQRSGPRPIYQQIGSWMRAQIASGNWPEHYKLPAETDLAAALRVSRGTIRKAIADLTADGLLMQIHGRGTFVSSQTLEQPLAERLLTFSDDLVSKNIPFETQVLDSVVTIPPPRAASLLGLPPDGRAFALRRLRTVAGQTRVLIHNYVAYHHCPGIETVDFTTNRLFETLEKRYHLQLDWGRRSFEAQSASAELAAALGIEAGAPVMALQQIVYLRGGSPIEMSDMWISGSHFRLSAIVKRGHSSTFTGDLYEQVAPPLWEINDV